MTTAIAQRDPAGTFILSSYVYVASAEPDLYHQRQCMTPCSYASAEDWALFGALFARDGVRLDGTRVGMNGV